ncbi:response regulator transcription factor [Hyphomicrobiales bacterium]|uniref:response regulator transcription factor n=1 Tax=Ensifer sp. R-19 TaxID=3404055 RepID=UPI000DDB6BA4
MITGLSTSTGGSQSLVSVPTETPVVFVVDDDVSVRDSLELLIRSAGWEPLLFDSARQFLSQPRACVPNCMVLDVNLPDLSGLDLQKMICVERTEMPIVFVTGYGDVPMTVKAMKAGAIEFLTKPFDDQSMLKAIEQALARSTVALALDAEMRMLINRHASLSRREQEVMALVITGLMNKQVAYELGISEVTVKAHRGKVMEKMQARSFAELINMASKLGLGDQPNTG